MENTSLVLVLLMLLQHVPGQTMEEVEICPPYLKCPDLQAQVPFPFTNSTHPDCGLLMIDCTQPQAMVQFEENGKWYNVTYIDQFPYQAITYLDPGIQNYLNTMNCDLFNNYSIPITPFVSYTMNNLTLFKCNSSDGNSPTKEYFTGYSIYNGCPGINIYYNYTNGDGVIPGTPQECSVVRIPKAWGYKAAKSNNLFELVNASVQLDYQVASECLDCHSKGGRCDQNAGLSDFNCVGLFECSRNGNERNVVIFETAIPGAGIGAIIMVLLLCLWRNLRSKRETDESVEAFIKRYGSLSPRRYSYSEIKKMTSSFKSELGKGGHGSVYKGKLLDGRLVAVKVLDRAKGRGEDFINEIVSIGRTSHVNVVTLLGFCFEGEKRALVYEFMPNGSLEKFIFAEQDSECRKLGWETLYRIALGIAQGLEYLHRGCNAPILHFDIKPHNILLDEDFCPKISDFGLAKLCPKKESIITMSDARGTLGYVAPEIFCRSIGGVSHKSDVYSYGMMVLEMVGGRKNINVGVDHTSQIYFPYWIYKQLEFHKEPRLEGITNEQDKQKAMKMILVSLWCIQTDPSNRPPISQVVDFLGGRVEAIPMPPRPFLSSPLGSPPRNANPL